MVRERQEGKEGAKADAAKRKTDILNPQIRALEAMDEALDTGNP